jgi:hypothetical protein
VGEKYKVGKVGMGVKILPPELAESLKLKCGLKLACCGEGFALWEVFP